MMQYTAIIEKEPATDWGAYVPDLPGCVAVGATREEVERLRCPTLRISAMEASMCRGAIAPVRTLSVSADEPANRFFECAEAAEADYLVTGNTRHYPPNHKWTQIVTGSDNIMVFRCLSS
jgi:hypothetical protein